MALIGYPPIPTFEQMNPGLVRARTISDLIGSLFKNYAQFQEARTAPEMAQANLAKALADAQYRQAEAQYYGPTAESEIGLRGSQAREYEAETAEKRGLLPFKIKEAEIQAKYPGLGKGGVGDLFARLQYMKDHPEANINLGLPTAQTGLPGTPITPDQYQRTAGAIQAMGDSGVQFNPQELLRGTAPAAQTNIADILGLSGMAPQPQSLMETLGMGSAGPIEPSSLAQLLQPMPQIAQQQQIPQQQMPQQQMGQVGLPQQQMAPVIAPQQQMPQPGAPATMADFLSQSILSKLQGETAKANYFNAMPAIRAAANPAMLAAASKSPDVARGLLTTMGRQFDPNYTPTAQNVKDFMTYSGDITEKRTSTAAMLNQRLYASNLDKQLTIASTLMPSVVKFAGAGGRAELIKQQAIAAAGGKTSEDYSKFYQFKTVSVPLIAADISRATGKNATDQENKALRYLTNPVHWDTNPELALKTWEWLITNFEGKYGPSGARLAGVNESLAQGNAEIRAKLAKGGKLEPITYTMADLDKTAKEKNMTVEQVKAQMDAIGGIMISDEGSEGAFEEGLVAGGEE